MTSEVALHLPSKYAPKQSGPRLPVPAPGLDFLTNTWTVTHSTLSMWRTARNVRITYTLIPAKPDGRPRLDDLVEYEPIPKPNKMTHRKTVAGIDTQADNGGWDWRGKGLLKPVGSHWEVLGWGEGVTAEGVREKWAVTWFAPTVFTKEGIDVYCDKKEGLSAATYEKIDAALKALGERHLVEMVEKDIRPVEIQLPWLEE
ncbi:Fc.00g028210.m01.CDS01 [Cosmosporella sp. VM-42]